MYDGANTGQTFENIGFSSDPANTLGIYGSSNGNHNIFRNCYTITTSNGYNAIGGYYRNEYYNCRIIGGTNGIYMGNNMSFETLVYDCYVEGTAGQAIVGGAVGGAYSRDGIIANCTLVSANEVLSFGIGNIALGYDVKFYNNNIQITGSPASAISIDGSTTLTTSLLRLLIIIQIFLSLLMELEIAICI